MLCSSRWRSARRSLLRRPRARQRSGPSWAARLRLGGCGGLQLQPRRADQHRPDAGDQHRERSVRAQCHAQSWAWLRTGFLVNLVSAEQLAYADFLTRVPEMAYVCTVRLEPVGALAVLELDLALAAPVIDLLLGGPGRPGEMRELTDIEDSILTSVVEILCRANPVRRGEHRAARLTGLEPARLGVTSGERMKPGIGMQRQALGARD